MLSNYTKGASLPQHNAQNGAGNRKFYYTPFILIFMIIIERVIQTQQRLSGAQT